MPLIDRMSQLLTSAPDTVGSHHRDLVLRLGRLRRAAAAGMLDGPGDARLMFESLLAGTEAGWMPGPQVSPTCEGIVARARAGVPITQRGATSLELEILTAALSFDLSAQAEGADHSRHRSGLIGLPTLERASRFLADAHRSVSPGSGSAVGVAPIGRQPFVDALGSVGLTPTEGLPDGIDDLLCFDLDLLCIDLFNQAARAMAGDPNVFPIPVVAPRAVCHDLLADTTFEAIAPKRLDVWSAGSDYTLYVGQHAIPDADIDERANGFAFRLPAGSTGGYVSVRNTAAAHVAMAEAIPVATMRNLCGFGGIPEEAADILPHPGGAYIAVVPKYEIEIVGPDASEACHTITVGWDFRFKEHPQWSVAPFGTQLRVTLSGPGDEPSATSDRFHGAYDEFGLVRGENVFTATATVLDADGAEICEPVTVEHSIVGEVLARFRSDAPLVDQLPTVVEGSGVIAVDLDLSCPVDDDTTFEVTVELAEGAEIAHAGQAIAHQDTFECVVRRGMATARAVTLNPLAAGTVTIRVTNRSDAEIRVDEAVYQIRIVEHVNAVVLSGGTLKGSFQAGALLALTHEWAQIEPKVITACSVGSINALPLAIAGPGNGSGTVKAARVWLDLERPTDVFSLTPEAHDLANHLDMDAEDLAELIAGIGEWPDIFGAFASFLANPGEWLKISPWALAFGVVFGPLGGILGGGAASFVKEAIEKLGDIKEVASLAPAQERIYDALGMTVDSDIADGIRLRLALNSARTGDMYYVDEGAQLINASTHLAEGVITETDLLLEDVLVRQWGPGDTQKLVVAALASSAQFGLIESRLLKTTTRASDYFMDGGHRELTPMQAAVDAGAHKAYVIGAQPTHLKRWPEGQELTWGRPLFEVLQETGVNLVPLAEVMTLGPASTGSADPLADQKLLPRIQRGIDVLMNEVNIEERRPRAGIHDEMERVMIVPDFEVHPSWVVHPGLIRINMAYGYMLAHDAYLHDAGAITDTELLQRRRVVNEIIDLRVRCIFREAEPWLIPQLQRNGAFRLSTLAGIRSLKHQIMVAMIERFRQCGNDPACFLPDLDAPGQPTQTTVDWFTKWEVHRNDSRPELTARDLWSRQKVQPLYSIDLLLPSTSPQNPGALTTVPLIYPWTEASSPPRPTAPALEAALNGRNGVAW